MGAGGGGGGGESGGGGGMFWERCATKRSARERCFCFMLLEMTRPPVVEGGEGRGEGLLEEDDSFLGLIGGGGGGTFCFCKQEDQQSYSI